MSPNLRCFVALALPTVLVACGDKDEGGVDTASECTAPTADAGLDASAALGGRVALDASDSEVCGIYADRGTVTYTWTFDRVPVDSALNDAAFSANASNAAITTSFSPDALGDYVVQLQVTDASGTSSDVIVISVESGDAPPIADCGEGGSVRVGERIDFDGSESYDPEGAALEYAWSLSTSPDCSTMTSSDLYDADAEVAALVPDCEGLYLVSLVVSDGDQWSAPSFCTVDVADGNRIPEADAGDSMELAFCAPNPLGLNGWGSYDLDGDDLEYLWTVTSVPTGSTVTDADIDDPTAAGARVNWDIPGTYVFELQVYDGTTWSAPDMVAYSIGAEDSNTTPVANAGRDVSVDAEGLCATASYVWECDDCPEASALLDGSSTYDPDGDPLTYQWSESTGAASFSNSNALVTDIVFPPMPAEYGVDNTLEVEADLTVQDCMSSDVDSVLVTYTCTGTYEPE